MPLIWCDDAVSRRMEAHYQMGRLAVPHVVRALRADDFDRNLEPERVVDAVLALGMAGLVIRLLGDDLVAEKAYGGRIRAAK